MAVVMNENGTWFDDETGEVIETLQPLTGGKATNHTSETRYVVAAVGPNERVSVSAKQHKIAKSKQRFTMSYDDDLQSLLPSLSPKESHVLLWLAAHLEYDGSVVVKDENGQPQRLTVGMLKDRMPWDAKYTTQTIRSLEGKRAITRVYENKRIVYVEPSPVYFCKGDAADRKRLIEAFYAKLEVARRNER